MESTRVGIAARSQGPAGSSPASSAIFDRWAPLMQRLAGDRPPRKAGYCPRCDVPLADGIALISASLSRCFFTPDAPRLYRCRKCPSCGHSET